MRKGGRKSMIKKVRLKVKHYLILIIREAELVLGQYAGTKTMLT